MSLLQKAIPGARILWGIGNRATGQFDEHPGVLLKEPEIGQDDRGREGLVAFVMLQRTNLAGETYLQPARILERYIDDRDGPAVTGLDATEDGEALTPADLMKAYGAQRKDFFVSGTPLVVGQAPAATTAIAETDAPSVPA
jgi:hypothetical protein